MKAYLVIAAAFALQACSNAAAAPAIVAAAQPRAEAQSYVRAEDYPASAASQSEEGSVRFALDIGIDGRVSGCVVTRSSESRSLDAATCRIMRSRARFTPARDSNGSPTASTVEQEVTWKLPKAAGPQTSVAPVGQITVAHSAPPAGYGMISNSTSPGTYVVPNIPGAILNEPIMAIPQDGPGEADLSVWDARKPKEIENLGRYPSIPKCRKAKAKLALDPQQRAYCTVAPVNYPDLGIH